MAKAYKSGKQIPMSASRSLVHGAQMVYSNVTDIHERIQAGQLLDAKTLLGVVLDDLAILRTQSFRLQDELEVELAAKKGGAS